MVLTGHLSIGSASLLYIEISLLVYRLSGSIYPNYFRYVWVILGLCVFFLLANTAWLFNNWDAGVSILSYVFYWLLIIRRVSFLSILVIRRSISILIVLRNWYTSKQGTSKERWHGHSVLFKFFISMICMVSELF